LNEEGRGQGGIAPGEEKVGAAEHPGEEKEGRDGGLRRLMELEEKEERELTFRIESSLFGSRRDRARFGLRSEILRSQNLKKKNQS